MPQPTAAQEDALRDRFDRDVAQARVSGEKPSDYFLDKCGAEAGDTYEAPAEGPELAAPRSPWAVLLGNTWLGRFIRR